ncbi:MAG: PilW family protein [Candidatus Accumulibacter sp.]|nr:PilW family protein [Accumulibacter sp.]
MKSSNRGFSLIEIMVALVIGMIGVLVIMQVARTAEAQKRVTTGSGESQTNAALAVYLAQRDIKQAGYGFNSLNVIGCKLSIPERDSIPAHESRRFVPVVINPGDEEIPEDQFPAGDAGTDTLLIAYGSSQGSPEGDTITVAPLPEGDNVWVGVASPSSFKADEWVFSAPVLPENGCALSAATIKELVPTSNPSTLNVPGLDAEVDQSLFSLGKSPAIVGYAIRGGNLTTCDYLQSDCSEADNWEVIANGIVSLQAQYGHDTGAAGDVDEWNRDTPKRSASPDQEKFACRWARVSAVRLALVARNSEPDREVVTSVDHLPSWAGGQIDLSAHTDLSAPDGHDWRNYRYQVYETVVPLRNLPWMGTCPLP